MWIEVKSIYSHLTVTVLPNISIQFHSELKVFDEKLSINMTPPKVNFLKMLAATSTFKPMILKMSSVPRGPGDE